MIRRGAAAAAVAVAAGALVLAGPAPAEASACSGTSGVTVVVDFGSLGGIQVGCAAGDPGSGLAALHAAGFTTTGTQKDGIKFVCRINGAPASDPCVLTPPASAYWSYWHESEGSWVYSGAGALVHDPHPGDIEGWAFGSGGRPGIAPPVAPAPKPPPRTTVPRQPDPPAPAPGQPRPSTAGAPPPAAPGGTTAGGPGTTARRPGQSQPGAATSGRPSTNGAPPTQGGASTTAPTPDPAAGAPSTSDPGPPESVATEPASSSKTLGAFALAVALIAAVGLAGFLIARRRRAAP